MAQTKTREQAQAAFAALSQSEQREAMDQTLARFQQTQDAQRAIFDKVQEVGGKIDLAELKLSEVDGHTAAMNQSIAELIVGLDGTAVGIESQIDSLQQNTTAETVIGWFSSKKATAMRETRVRGASIDDNLNNLLTKSNRIADLLQQQLDVILRQKAVVDKSLRDVLSERETTLAEKADLTRRIDVMIPEINALQEQIQNEADPAARAVLQSRFEEKNSEYGEAKNREQELLVQSMAQESHAATYRTYLDSLVTQEGTQRILLNKIKTDTSHRTRQWSALIDSMKTAAIQNNAHQLNNVGGAVDKKARTIMAGIAIGSEKAAGEMMASHEGNMQQAAAVREQRKRAQEAFDQVFGSIMEKHDNDAYGRPSH